MHESRRSASVQGDAIPIAGTRKLHVPRASIDLLPSGVLLNFVWSAESKDIRSLTLGKSDDLEGDLLVSSTVRNRHYHPVPGLRAKT
jgi:hypothetical protein